MTKIEGAVVSAVSRIAGAPSAKSLGGLVLSGSMVVNDWLITMQDVEGGHVLTARRGTEVQTMFIRDGSGEAGNGGYYVPDVSDSGELTWTPSREGMPAVEPSSIVGPPGEPGQDGKDGAPGPQGEKGERGEPGPAGPQGERGEPGADGYTPIKGVDYFDGERGPQGERGEPGPQGERGEPGPVGPQGEIGPQGIPGEAGPQGEPGKDGTPGRDGFSPAVSVAGIDGGHRVTITDAEGAKSFDVLDGAVDRAQIVADVLAALPAETWTFTLEDGSTVDKAVVVR